MAARLAETSLAVTAHVGRAARLSQRQGMVSAFAASDKAGKPAWKRDMVRTATLLAHPMKG